MSTISSEISIRRWLRSRVSGAMGVSPREFRPSQGLFEPMSAPSYSREWNAAEYPRLSAPQFHGGDRVLSQLQLHGDECVLDAACAAGKLNRTLLENLPRGKAAWSRLASQRRAISNFSSICTRSRTPSVSRFLPSDSQRAACLQKPAGPAAHDHPPWMHDCWPLSIARA
jgi:hypothetical protein